MRITCKYSGLELASYKHFSHLHVADTHPIFAVKQQCLFGMLHQWEDMQSQEKHLYYLALANSTGLVTFHIPSKPTRKIMESTINRLATIVGWIAEFQANWSRQYQLDFPRYRIASDNADCKNIGEWLAALEAVKQDWYDGKAVVEHRHAMKQKEKQLELMARQGITTKKFTKMLAEWAIDVSCEDEQGITESTKQFWLDLMCTSKDKLYQAVIQGHPVTTNDVDELIAHFETTLPHGDSAVAYTVMQHVRELRKAYSSGLGLYSILDDIGLGGDLLGATSQPATTGSLATSSDSDSTSSEVEVNQPVANCSLPRPTQATIDLYLAGEPVSTAYPTRVAYLLQRAKFGTAKQEVLRYLQAGGKL